MKGNSLIRDIEVIYDGSRQFVQWKVLREFMKMILQLTESNVMKNILNRWENHVNKPLMKTFMEKKDKL